MRTERFEELAQIGPPNERAWRLRIDGEASVFCRVMDLGDDRWVWDAWVPTTEVWKHGEAEDQRVAARAAKKAAVDLASESLSSSEMNVLPEDGETMGPPKKSPRRVN